MIAMLPMGLMTSTVNRIRRVSTVVTVENIPKLLMLPLEKPHV